MKSKTPKVPKKAIQNQADAAAVLRIVRMALIHSDPPAELTAALAELLPPKRVRKRLGPWNDVRLALAVERAAELLEYPERADNALSKRLREAYWRAHGADEKDRADLVTPPTDPHTPLNVLPLAELLGLEPQQTWNLLEKHYVTLERKEGPKAAAFELVADAENLTSQTVRDHVKRARGSTVLREAFRGPKRVVTSEGVTVNFADPKETGQ
jgi:hypothetical protein